MLMPSSPRRLLELFLLFKEERGLESMLDRIDFTDVDPKQAIFAALGRLSEPSDFRPDRPAKRLLQQALHSPEFQTNIIRLIFEAFPEKRRKIFIHVPKCAGTDLAANLSPAIFPVAINYSLTATNWTSHSQLFSKIRDIILELHFSEDIFLHGHLPLSYLINNRLLRYEDHVFTVVRSPTSIIISQVNYIMTRFINDPDQTLPDTREWLKMMNLSEIPKNASSAYFRDLATKVLKNQTAIRKNYICSYLGKGDFKSAIHNITSSNIEIADIGTYKQWMKDKWGVRSDTRINVSNKVMSEDGLSEYEKEYINSITSEDRRLYEMISKELSSNSSMSTFGGLLV